MPPPLAYSHITRGQSQWCWAAVAHGVMSFYPTPRPLLTQCEVATRTLRNDNIIPAATDCCVPADAGTCNLPYALDSALRTTGNDGGAPAAVGFYPPWPTAQMATELAAGRVIGVRVRWNGGGEHFVVVFGYDVVNGLEYVHVSDPDPKAGPPSQIPLWQLATAYRQIGVWNHLYATQP